MLLPHELVHELAKAGELQAAFVPWHVSQSPKKIGVLKTHLKKQMFAILALQFQRSMTGYKSGAGIAEFWDHCATLDEWADHPVLLSGVPRERSWIN